MNNTLMIIYLVVLGLYFIGLAVFTIVKRQQNKKKVEKEHQDYVESKRKDAESKDL